MDIFDASDLTGPVELFERFPNEQAATEWLKDEPWPDGDRFCPHCGCLDAVQDVPNAKAIPYRCAEGKRCFSLLTGAVTERSPIPRHKWLRNKANGRDVTLPDGTRLFAGSSGT